MPIDYFLLQGKLGERKMEPPVNAGLNGKTSDVVGEGEYKDGFYFDPKSWKQLLQERDGREITTHIDGIYTRTSVEAPTDWSGKPGFKASRSSTVQVADNHGRPISYAKYEADRLDVTTLGDDTPSGPIKRVITYENGTQTSHDEFNVREEGFPLPHGESIKKLIGKGVVYQLAEGYRSEVERNKDGLPATESVFLRDGPHAYEVKYYNDGTGRNPDVYNVDSEGMDAKDYLAGKLFDPVKELKADSPEHKFIELRERLLDKAEEIKQGVYDDEAIKQKMQIFTDMGPKTGVVGSDASKSTGQLNVDGIDDKLREAGLPTQPNDKVLTVPGLQGDVTLGRA